MAKLIKRCNVEPIRTPLQLNEMLMTEIDSDDRPPVSSHLQASDPRSCWSPVVAWFASLRFEDKRLELMYDSYVVKFSEYSVRMLMILLSIDCLKELVFYFVVGHTRDHLATEALLMTFVVALTFIQVYVGYSVIGLKV